MLLVMGIHGSHELESLRDDLAVLSDLRASAPRAASVVLAGDRNVDRRCLFEPEEGVAGRWLRVARRRVLDEWDAGAVVKLPDVVASRPGGHHSGVCSMMPLTWLPQGAAAETQRGSIFRLSLPPTGWTATPSSCGRWLSLLAGGAQRVENGCRQDGPTSKRPPRSTSPRASSRRKSLRKSRARSSPRRGTGAVAPSAARLGCPPRRGSSTAGRARHAPRQSAVGSVTRRARCSAPTSASPSAAVSSNTSFRAETLLVGVR